VKFTGLDSVLSHRMIQLRNRRITGYLGR